MTAIMQTLLFMLAVLAAVAVAAKRLNIAPSILLVVAGIGMAFVPGLPKVELAPELVLLVILPPLIYSAGVAMSWREFRFNLRPIIMLAFGCVLFTTCLVATAAHYLLNFDWSVGFLLGAIVSPPDVVAPLAIARRLGLPRRIVVVLEGEGLANDATALVLYRFAVVAVSTGTFSLSQAAGEFAMIVIGEIAFGLAVGWLSLHLRQWAREPRVEITLSLLTPYLAFWVPAHFGGSGVLAFFFNDPATTEIYTLSLHDALPIFRSLIILSMVQQFLRRQCRLGSAPKRSEEHTSELQSHSDLVCRLLLEKKK